MGLAYIQLVTDFQGLLKIQQDIILVEDHILKSALPVVLIAFLISFHQLQPELRQQCLLVPFV